MPAHQVPIHHVDVHQREGVHELDADRGGQGILSGTADGPRAQQHQRGADRLSAGIRRLARGVPPAKLVPGDQPELRLEAVDPALGLRLERLPGPAEQVSYGPFQAQIRAVPSHGGDRHRKFPPPVLTGAASTGLHHRPAASRQHRMPPRSRGGRQKRLVLSGITECIRNPSPPGEPHPAISRAANDTHYR